MSRKKRFVETVGYGSVPEHDKWGAYESGADAPSLVEALSCNCPRRREGGCVENLGLPGLMGQFTDGHGRVWTLLKRTRHGDPTGIRVQRTTVLLRRIEHGQTVYKTFHCAAAPVVENQYERNRVDRPPASARLPFQTKKPTGAGP
ncbi:hypothetical protein ACFC6U_13330 [Kitasatospora purpeofusca]|uniref:hypothetical protein n=1 Tax=Kitasatospora purpeofusca TaxID=67352 RepID=UPI0035E13825